MKKIYFQSFYLTTNILFIENCFIIYQIQMQFPNCTAKVSVLSARTKYRHIFRMFYNIVLEFKGIVYTYKQFVVHREYTFQ